MKVRFVFDKKAQDAPISLSGVTFDTARFDEVVKAFRTLGPDDKVAKMVKLTSRTNKVMTFNITGDENQLKKFFEQFYVHMTWEEVKSKFRPGQKQNQEETKEDKQRLETKFVEFLKKWQITFDKFVFNFDESALKIIGLKGEVKKIRDAAFITDLNKTLKPFGYEFKELKNLDKSKRIDTVLENIEIKLEELTSSD